MINARIDLFDRPYFARKGQGWLFVSRLDANCMSVLGATSNLLDIEFVTFDVETTGLSPVVARLVELSGVKFKLSGGDVSTFSSLINPECPIPPEASAVHGITQKMVSDAPTFREVVPQFFEWVGDESVVLAAHNAPFDVGFLRCALAKLNSALPSYYVVDTLPLSRQLLPESPNHQLRTLVEHLKLEGGDYHRALADSHHVRHMLHRLIKGDNELKVWGDLLNLYCVFGFNQEDECINLIPPAVRQSVESIKAAILQSTEVTFVYNAYGYKERTVKPLSVVQNRGNYYLTAYCYHVEEERTFRVDKISNLKTT